MEEGENKTVAEVMADFAALILCRISWICCPDIL